MEIHEISQVNDALAEMVALFRVELRSYKGILSKPNLQAGREEMEEYLSAGFPVFAAVVNGEYAGYMVCRVDDGIVWVESLFVKENTAARVWPALCTAKPRNWPPGTARTPFTTMFTPTTTA